MSIKDITQKIKWSKLYLPSVTILLILAIFGLSELYNLNKSREVFTISNLDIPKSIKKPEKVLVGSKNGKKYYLPTCSGASRILESNQIWFTSAEEAQSFGYTPAKGCF